VTRLIIYIFFIFFLQNFSLADNLAQNNLEADSIEYNKFDNNNVVITANGNVLLTKDKKKLHADQLIYNQSINKVTAKGNIILELATGEKIISQEIILDKDFAEAAIDNMHFIFSDGTVLSALSAYKFSNKKYALNNACYTACKIKPPHSNPLWQIKAKKVIIDKTNNRISYNNLFFEIYGIPIFFTPYFSHPTPDAPRKSGFLTPKIGINSYIGKHVTIPYYLNISPSSDFTLNTKFTSRRGILLNPGYRKLFSQGNLNFNLHITDAEGLTTENLKKNATRYYLQSKAYFWKDELRFGFDINRTSDKTFTKNYQLIDENDTSLTSKFFLEKKNYNNNYKLTTLNFQNLSPNAKFNLNDAPYVLPLFESKHLLKERDQSNLYLKTHLALIEDSRLELKTKDDKIETTKFDTKKASFNLIHENHHIFDNGIVGTMHTSLRSEIFTYNFKNNSPSYTKSRMIPQIYTDFKYPLISENNKIILEPITAITLMPHKDYNRDILSNDSQFTDLSDNNLFAPTRSSGIDLIENGSKVAYGLKSSIRTDAKGKYNIVFGQAYNFYDKNHLSNYVGRTNWQYENLDISYRFELAKKTLSLLRNEIDIITSFDPVSIELGYVGFSDGKKDANGITNKKLLKLGFGIQITEEIKLTTKSKINLTKRKNDPTLNTNNNRLINLENELSFKGECVDYSIIAKRDYTSGNGKQAANTWLLKLSLKNLTD